MRIGVDISITAFNDAGNARYSNSLLKALQVETHGTDVSLIPLQLPAKLSIPRAGFKRKSLVLFWEFIYEPFIINWLAARSRCDLVHATAPSPVPYRDIPLVTTVHDVIPFHHPEWFTRMMRLRVGRWISTAIRQSSHLIVDSCNTKRDIEALPFYEGGKMTVVYPGPSDLGNDGVSSNATSLRVTEPYILVVGTIEPRKNLQLVLEAYGVLRSQLEKPPKLFVVGATGWMQDKVSQHIQSLNLTNHITLLGFVSDQDLKQLYAHAQLFVYPSLYEGFGFPPLEAMAAGCPVIVSHSSSLPEVVGDAGILIDPSDKMQLARAMQLVLDQPSLAEKMGVQGVKQATSFSWKKCAQETIEVYRQVLGR